jgi:hypothetical protein
VNDRLMYANMIHMRRNSSHVAINKWRIVYGQDEHAHRAHCTWKDKTGILNDPVYNSLYL